VKIIRYSTYKQVADTTKTAQHNQYRIPVKSSFISTVPQNIFAKCTNRTLGGKENNDDGIIIRW
jgi:hypothetical protein